MKSITVVMKQTQAEIFQLQNPKMPLINIVEKEKLDQFFGSDEEDDN